jgi:hypothetical protein
VIACKQIKGLNLRYRSLLPGAQCIVPFDWWWFDIVADAVRGGWRREAWPVVIAGLLWKVASGRRSLSYRPSSFTNKYAGRRGDTHDASRAVLNDINCLPHLYPPTHPSSSSSLPQPSACLRTVTMKLLPFLYALPLVSALGSRQHRRDLALSSLGKV